MSKAAILFNGIRFPFVVIDHAFEWARGADHSLRVIYLLARHEISDGYVFPSDLDISENLSDDAETTRDNDAVIRSNMQMLNHRAQLEGISFESLVLIDPSTKQLSEAVKDCKYIFVDEDIDEMTGSNIDINIKKWSVGFTGSVQTVR